MKITKFVHSCLLVEMPEPVNRTALFDPGSMSSQALRIDTLEFLDDIIITHNHADHLDETIMQQLVAKFPNVRITGPREVVQQLSLLGITAHTEESEGVSFFTAPHENVMPLFPQPENVGIHYLNMLSNPGDSHSFTESMPILALPITAPWGSTVTAVNLALKLQPRYILPIHDWHWSDTARESTYSALKELFAQHDITFIKLKTGQSETIEV